MRQHTIHLIYLTISDNTILQVILCTHLAPDAAFTNKMSVDSFGTVLRPGDLADSTFTSMTTAGATVTHAVSFAGAGTEAPVTAVTTATTATVTNSGVDAEAEMFTVRMAPLLIPVLCKVSK